MANPLAPWWRPGQLFLAGAWIALGLPMGIITFVVMITLGALSIGLMPAFLLGVPVAWIAFDGGARTRPYRAVPRQRLRRRPDRRPDPAPHSDDVARTAQ